MSLELSQIMQPEEMKLLGTGAMTPEQQKCLIDWGLRMYSLGQHMIEDIEDIKYDGRLIILNNDTRWEVDSSDAYTTDMWSSSEKVLVLDDVMYNLDQMEKVEVTEEG